MKKIVLLSLLITTLFACKKEAPNEAFQGTYKITSNGDIKATALGRSVIDTTLVNEPGKVIISRGVEDDEIMMYVETNFVSGVAPLGVYAKAKVDGKNYTMEERSESITATLGGLSVDLMSFTVNATGTLSDDGKTLTSEVIFTGGITGNMKCVGKK